MFHWSPVSHTNSVFQSCDPLSDKLLPELLSFPCISAIVISLGWLLNRHVVPLDDYFSPRLKGIVSNQQGLDEDTSHACNNDPH